MTRIFYEKYFPYVSRTKKYRQELSSSLYNIIYHIIIKSPSFDPPSKKLNVERNSIYLRGTIGW